MNKKQKEVELAKLKDEAKELKHLKAIYNKAADDISKKITLSNGKINVMLSHFDELDDTEKSILQSQIYQRNFQNSLKTQIDGFLKDLESKQYDSIDSYLKDCYETGFIGSVYDLHGQGIPLIMPIDQKQVVAAIKLDPKISKNLYTKLGEDVAFLKKRIANNVSRGIATASEYKVIARNIAADSNVGFNRAMRIARTEGHGVQVQAAVDVQHKAKSAGADIVKQWDAALDGRTRDSHRMVDGEIRELDEKFSNNMMYPSDPAGGAAEVVNCRCALLQRAKWALDDDELQTLKDRAAYYGLDKTESFEDFKKKYLKATEKISSEEEIRLQIQEYNDKISANADKIRRIDENIARYNSNEYDEYLDVKRKDVEKQLNNINLQLEELNPKIDKYFNGPERGTEEYSAWREYRRNFDYDAASDKQIKLSLEQAEKQKILKELDKRDEWLNWKKKHPIDQMSKQKSDYESEAIRLKNGLKKLQQNYLKTIDNLNAAGYNIVNISYIEKTYGATHAKAVKDSFKNAPPEVKRVWSKYQGDFKTVDANYSGTKANYSPIADAVTLNITDVAKGNSLETPYQVLFHEYGHMTDYLAARAAGFNRITAFTEVFDGLDANGDAVFTQAGGLLGRTAKEELKEILNDIKKNHGVTRKNEAARILIDEITNNYSLIARGDLSDILEGAGIGIAYPVGAGHGLNYWKSRDNSKEIFAELISAETNNPDSLDCIKKYFPKTYQVYKDIIEVIK